MFQLCDYTKGQTVSGSQTVLSAPGKPVRRIAGACPASPDTGAGPVLVGAGWLRCRGVVRLVSGNLSRIGWTGRR